nr:hypothetical protein KIEKDOEP_00047 [Escherichia coli]
MPVDFLTTEQTESYGRFTGEPDELQLARYFHLDEADKEFIGKSRGDHNRLGIALQIGCVRFLGTFLTDMNHIPSGVRHFTARQLGIRDITVLAEYGQRENTRREHAALIRQHYQYREFAWPWTFRLTRLLYTRSWISNERPGLLFDLATGWLMQHRIILPGTVAKLAMRQPFVLFKGLTFQKLCLPGAFRPGDHHNKMLRPGLCVVHASPQYL